MSHPHVARRRARYSPRAHAIADNEPRRLTYKVAGATSHEAIAAAKSEAALEGWVLRTVASCRPSDDGGQWLVTLVAARER